MTMWKGHDRKIGSIDPRFDQRRFDHAEALIESAWIGLLQMPMVVGYLMNRLCWIGVGDPHKKMAATRLGGEEVLQMPDMERLEPPVDDPNIG